MRSNKYALLLGLGAACGIPACGGDDVSATAPIADAAVDGTALDGSSHPNDAAVPVDAAAPVDAPLATDAPLVTDAPVSNANAVYTMTNASAGNQILGFKRAADGSLTPMAAPFATLGKGTGASLGEQGAIAYDTANARLYAVNAGDDSFSIFAVAADGSLGAAVNVAVSGITGGAGLVGPKSVTFHEDTVYVLFEGNATTPSAIAGWTISGTTATAVPGSILPLSSASQSADPAQLQFSPDGMWLVATEKQSGAGGSVAGSGSIDTFSVDGSGLATKVGFYPTASAGADAGVQLTPYGFAFFGDTLVVSEAGSTGVGTYTYAGGAITPVSGGTQFLPTDPAPCWVAVSSDWAYVANAKGPDVSGFTIGAGGSLSNIGAAANAVVAMTGTTVATDAGPEVEGPTDETVSADGQFLYVLDGAVPAIGVFKVNGDGSLTRVGAADYTAASLVAGIQGLAAR